ncbi:MAG: F0F1 ATP synthase subunit delta [Lachnospira eligens]
MVSKDRQKKIVDTLEYFRKRVLEYKKIGIAYVSTAKPLTDEQKKAVAGKLLETTIC